MEPLTTAPPLGLIRGPSTRLVRVLRDGNPARLHGFAWPFLGKLGPLDLSSLDRLMDSAAGSLPVIAGRSLVVGLTESSLVLAWGLIARLTGPADLCFTTRRPIDGSTVRTFQEPHSHGPRHFLTLRPGVSYDRVVIVEDEVTTGVTVANLITALSDVSDRFSVVSLTDFRTLEQKSRWAYPFQARGIEVAFSEVRSRSPVSPRARPRTRRWPNPYQRDRADLGASIRVLRRAWLEVRPGLMAVVGESMDLALPFWMSIPPADRPILRHVTRSPWQVDGRAIVSRLDLGHDGPVRHYLYNEGPPATDRALILGDSSTGRVLDDLGDHFRSQGIRTRILETPAR